MYKQEEKVFFVTGEIITVRNMNIPYPPSSFRNIPSSFVRMEMTNWTDDLFLCRYAPQTRVRFVDMESRKTAALKLINLFSGRSSPQPSTAADIKTMIYTLLSPTDPGKDLFYFIFSHDSKTCLVKEIPSSSSNATSDVDKNSKFSNDGDGFWRKAFSEIEKLTDADLEANNREHLGLMYLSAIGFICLTLFQMKGRDVRSMSQYMRTQMSQVFEKLYKPPKGFVRIPDYNDDCLNKISSYYDRNCNSNIQEAFGLVLTGYLYFAFGPNVDHGRVSVLMDGCLSHLMYNGLHMFKLFDQVMEKANMDHKQLKDKLCDSKTVRIFEKIMHVYELNSHELKFKNHVYLGSMTLKPQISWKWSRLFDEDYFRLCAAYRFPNTSLCARLAAILSKYPEHSGIINMGIFRSPQAKEDFHKEASFAKEFFEKYCSKN